MPKNRKYYSPDEKIALLRLHLLDKISIAELCRKHSLCEPIVYRWRQQLFENGATAFWPSSRHCPKPPAYDKCKATRNDRRLQRHLQEVQILVDALQGKVVASNLEALSSTDAAKLLECMKSQPLKYRNRAAAVVLHFNKVLSSRIARLLGVSQTAVDNWIARFKTQGVPLLVSSVTREYRKAEDEKYRNAVFEILHAPPSNYGINRTAWRIMDLHLIMAQQGLPLACHNIRRIIRDAGYHYRKAKKVLTSTDPDYRRKLEEITRILRNIRPTERFFSIDEFGPFAVKKRGGKSLVLRGHARTIPQHQPSKGCLIVTGALELLTNQMTHFYSPAKNTREMIKLLDILVQKYADQKRLYFSWDAASWHASKELYARVDQINSRAANNAPYVHLVPLPCSAQFLNVIESVFSGMARAVLHNSDYKSVGQCRAAIDRHFEERNAFFRRNPKRAGNRIWGKERVKPQFSDTNNCKDPRYR